MVKLNIPNGYEEKRHMQSRTRSRVLQATCLLTAAVATPAISQQIPPPKEADGKEWHFAFAPYLWFANMDGDVVTRGIPSEVNADFSDIWDDLDFGFMANFELRGDRWGFIFNPIYLSLSDQGTFPQIPAELDVELDTLILEGFVDYQATPNLDVFAGARYTDIDGNVDLTTPAITAAFGGSQSWTDPVLGARMRGDIGRNWAFHIRGDIGGFGVESDLVLNGHVLVGRKFGHRQQYAVFLGYRALDYDFSEGSGTNRFEFDMTIKGPLVGAVFTF